MSEEQASSRQRIHDPEPLETVWEQHAPEWIAWARTPGHDSYWRFHRDAFLELVPPAERRTLDIGCGEGRLSRDLALLGHRVVGLDASPTAVAAAREADPSIEVQLGDAARLPFADGFADLALAFMSLQDVADAAAAIHEVARVLEPGGRFCLAVVHPFNSAGQFAGNEPDSPFTVSGSYFEIHRYRDVIERAGMRLTLESEHRPIGWYAEALAAAGFVIERMREFAVPEEAVTLPRQRRWQRIPLFLHIRALRP
jgi:SAM-dependent methyltransferase